MENNEELKMCPEKKDIFIKSGEGNYRDGYNQAVDDFMKVINSESGHVKHEWKDGNCEACMPSKPSPSTCDQWLCKCGYMNLGEVCTKCGTPKYSPSPTTEQQDLAVFIWESLSTHVGFYPVNAEKCNEIAREWFKRKDGNSKEQEIEELAHSLELRAVKTGRGTLFVLGTETSKEIAEIVISEGYRKVGG